MNEPIDAPAAIENWYDNQVIIKFKLIFRIFSKMMEKIICNEGPLPISHKNVFLKDCERFHAKISEVVATREIIYKIGNCKTKQNNDECQNFDC